MADFGGIAQLVAASAFAFGMVMVFIAYFAPAMEPTRAFRRHVAKLAVAQMDAQKTANALADAALKDAQAMQEAVNEENFARGMGRMGAALGVGGHTLAAIVGDYGTSRVLSPERQPPMWGHSDQKKSHHEPLFNVFAAGDPGI